MNQTAFAQPVDILYTGKDTPSTEVRNSDRLGADILNLVPPKDALPREIRASFTQLTEAKNQLVNRDLSSSPEQVRDLFVEFKRSIVKHMHKISTEMYMPIKAKLDQETGNRHNRFRVFEQNTLKAYDIVGIFVSKYNKVDPTQDVSLSDDVERVFRIVANRMHQERAYLFPLYSHVVPG